MHLQISAGIGSSASICLFIVFDLYLSESTLIRLALELTPRSSPWCRGACRALPLALLQLTQLLVILQSTRLLTSRTTFLMDMHTWLLDLLVGWLAWLQAWPLALWATPVSGVFFKSIYLVCL